ncbi:unnamed protein product, partial [Polarella glacialis]
ETGFIGIIDWSPRVVAESYFQPARSLDVFLAHRSPKTKVRWVHCAAVSRPTVLRLAVKYQLHPLPVEDTIQLQQQSVPLVRSYGDNFFIIIPLLRLTSDSLAALDKHRHRHRACGKDAIDASLEEPCLVQVEQGRLALFVSGQPRFDTIISVQTRWLARRSEDGRSSMPGEAARTIGPTRCCRRSRRPLETGTVETPRPSRAASEVDSLGNETFQVSASLREEDFDPTKADDIREGLGTEAFDEVVREIQKDFSILRAGNASWLLWRLMDVCVDELMPILAAYRVHLQWFAAHIAQHRARAASDIEKLMLRTKVELDWLQRKARPMVRVVKHLIHDKTIDPDVTRYLEDVEDHLETFIEEVSRSMGICDSLRDQVRSFRDRERQGVLYVLALVTTMFTPLQLLTGMYGMNWQDVDGKPVVPGLGVLTAERGWFLFWGLGAAIVLSIYLCFRLVLKWI